MVDDDEGFVSRWSRLKRSGGTAKQETSPVDPLPDEPEPAATVESAADPAAGPEGGAADPADPSADLPAIEDLTKDSDFTVFMREGVPDAIRNQALRKLWTSDPVLANLDGLLEYGEDFSLPFKQHAGKAVATLWRVGQGMPDPVKEAILDAVEGGEDADRADPHSDTSAVTVAVDAETEVAGDGAEGEPSPATKPPGKTA